jgi:ABC-2 type transport system ATP-binding protein
VLAAAGGHPESRIDEMLDLVQLTRDGGRRVKGYSMGMRQRLAIASALLGDPKVLILDEPTNGLDPEGIRWFRQLLRHQASEGRTVLVSSHLLSEVAQSVDDVIVLARGQLRARGSLDEVLGQGGGETVTQVRSPYRDHMAAALEKRGHKSQSRDAEWLDVYGATPEQVGIAAAEDGITLYGLQPRQRSLEDTFLQLTGEHPEPT